jgi:glucose-6-phosphate isomerase
MLIIDTSNLTKISPSQGLKPSDLLSLSRFYEKHISGMHSRKQGFYRIFEDKKYIKDIEEYAKSVKGKFSDIVLLGIGGSALGTICLNESLKPIYTKELSYKKKHPSYPRLHVIDNIDPEWIDAVNKLINYKKTLFIVVTKSGTTPETMAQYCFFRKKANEKRLDPKKHFVFITDPDNGLLRKIGKAEKIPCFEVPKNIGGRFSVLTPVGLLPAKLIGINIKEMMSWAEVMKDMLTAKSWKNNLPWQLAAIQYLLYKKGKKIDVLMPYSQKLQRFSDWFKQLLAESIGKKHIGITPVNALGATDQHSQSQLFNEGPNDKLIIFLQILNHGKNIKIPVILPKAEELKFMRNVSFGQLLDTEMEGTRMALTKNNRPNITICMDELDAGHMGFLFMLFEGATALLGEMMNVNAFNQPGVELSKIITKELLLKKK